MKYLIILACLFSMNAQAMVQCNPSNKSLLTATEAQYQSLQKSVTLDVVSPLLLLKFEAFRNQVFLCYGEITDKEFCQGSKYNGVQAATLYRDEFRKSYENGTFSGNEFLQVELALHEVESYCHKKGLL